MRAPVRLDPLTQERALFAAATRPTPLGQYLYESARQGLRQNVVGSVVEEFATPPTSGGLRDKLTSIKAGARISQEQWKASPDYREGIPWDDGMTAERAKVLAEQFDRNRWRDSLYARYEGGVLGHVAGIGAQFAGAALDPVNYIPILGPAARAAAIARLGVVTGRVAIGAAEATLATAAMEPIIVSNLNARGENIGLADVALDLALSGVAGGLFGAGGGVLANRAVRRAAARSLKIAGVQRQLDALNLAADAIREDEPVDVGRVVRPDAVLRRRLMTSTVIPEEVRFAERAPLDEELPDAGLTTVPKVNKPRSLLAFLHQTGGLRDDAGELRSRDIHKMRPGLIRKKGVFLDDAALKAWEAGYIGYAGGERPTPDDLLAAIDEELRGRRVYPFDDADWIAGEEAMAAQAGEDRSLDEALIAMAEEHGGLSGNELAIARQLARDHELAYDDAIVEAITLAALRNDAGGFDAAGITADDFDVPFDEVPAGIDGGGRAAGDFRGAPADGPPRPLFGQQAAAGTLEDDIARAVRDSLALEQAPQRHPSITEAERRLPLLTKERAEIDGLAADLGVEGGEVPEMDDIAILRRDARLTPEDEAALAAAEEDARLAENYAMAYETLGTCVARFVA